MTPERNIYSIGYSKDDANLTLVLKDVKQQNDLGLNETITKGFQILDARYSRKLVSESGTEVYASFFGSNLLDEVARNHTSFVKNEVPLAGRNLGVSFSVKF
jgi:iron complex outermembrane receptor protein